mmetsp:Transcript_12434/g.35235  ORF Transcript_12434/g.35235 Transcript_12434/m.35235 type:complete len:262 (+) Transcript_12434:129-914(+)
MRAVPQRVQVRDDHGGEAGQRTARKTDPDDGQELPGNAAAHGHPGGLVEPRRAAPRAARAGPRQVRRGARAELAVQGAGARPRRAAPAAGALEVRRPPRRPHGLLALPDPGALRRDLPRQRRAAAGRPHAAVQRHLRVPLGRHQRLQHCGLRLRAGLQVHQEVLGSRRVRRVGILPEQDSDELAKPRWRGAPRDAAAAALRPALGGRPREGARAVPLLGVHGVRCHEGAPPGAVRPQPAQTVPRRVPRCPCLSLARWTSSY